MNDRGDRLEGELVERGLTREELLRRAAVGGALLATGAFAHAGDALAAPTIKRGGRLRVGVPGGSSSDLLDGQHIVTEPDIARLVATFEGLSVFDDSYKPKIDGLAEELEAEKANQWLIRVRDGIEFHNGKTLTADDVIYSIRRTTNPKLGLFGHAGFASVDPKRIRKLDNRTVRLFLKQPDVNLLDAFSQYFQGIVPVGYSPNGFGSRGNSPLRYIGTGAYKVKSFVPGRQSVHVKNENYWRSGQPYFDEIVIIDFPDDTARVNALLGGQVDVISDLPYSQAKVVRGRQGLKLYEAPSGAWTPITMAVDQPPFNDVRVRQAFRLIANRPQMLRASVAGHGRIGNDVYSPSDPCYAGGSFPQRRQDIEKARSLLKQAGQEGITIDLFTTPGDIGMVENAQVFASNAKQAGLTVNVRNDPNFYGDQYLKYTFATDFWGTRNYLSQVAVGSLPGSTYNETHWGAGGSPAEKRFLSLHKQALATVDNAKRCEIIAEMQRLEYDEGGHIIPWFKSQLAAYSAKVGGFKRDIGNLTLNKYGNGFRTIYFV
jgi:peptide/nickel transport system substrate-binding protein